MDFFNKLGKKATELYKATDEKTRQLSGEMKLKNKINDCNNKIAGEYKKLGKMIFDNRTNGETATEDDIQNVCMTISNYMKEIEKAELDILTLKNIKKCDNCSAEIDLHADFCPKCGTKQAKPVDVEVQSEPVADTNAIEVSNTVDNVNSTENNEPVEENPQTQENTNNQ